MAEEDALSCACMRRATAIGPWVWCMWGAGSAAALWAAYEPGSMGDLVPILVVATLTGQLLHHFGVAGWIVGALAATLAVLVIPAVDLLLHPLCEPADGMHCAPGSDDSAG